MKKNKQLGICMDHSTAYIMELLNDRIVNTKVELEPIGKEEDDNLERHEENEFYKAKQQHQLAYYKKIGDIIKNYHEVLLFGPTEAKNELYNLLRKDHHFQDIIIEIESTQMLSEPQMQSFVKEFFK